MRQSNAKKAEAKNNLEKIKALAEKGKENFYFFMRYILGSAAGFELIEEVPHKEMCDMAQKWNKRKKIILTPRDTFKTTIFVVGYAIWRIINNPEIAILLTSDKQSNSIQSLAAIKNVIESHELFKLCYGNLKGSIVTEDGGKRSWSEKQITVGTRKGNKRAPTIMTAGVDSPKVGMHFDLILFDDPHNEKNISTPEQIIKVIKYYKGLHPLMDTLTGHLQITATRWHHQDVNNHVLTEEQGKWDVLVRASDWEEDGEIKLFYPNRLTLEFLEERKQDLGTYFFSCQYRNNPVDDENALFKSEQLQYFSDFEDSIIFTENGMHQLKIRKKELSYFISVDPSGSGSLTEQRRKDYTGFVVVGVDHLERWFVFEALRKRNLQPSDIVDMLMAYHYKYKPEMIGIEHITYQGQIKKDLEKEFEKKRIYQWVKDLHHHNREKLQRIRGLQPLYKRKKVYHAKGLYDLERELLCWSPNSTIHDDIIDPLAYMCDMVVSPEKVEVNTAEKIDHYKCPNWFITADRAWAKSGCRGSFKVFLENWRNEDATEYLRQEEEELKQFSQLRV